MGYRSHVCACIYGPRDEMIAFVAAQNLLHAGEISDMLDLRLECTKFGGDKHDGYLIWSMEWEDIKWYDRDAEVILWANLQQASADVGLCGEFIRVGEDDTDIEMRHWGDNVQWYLGIERSIIDNYPPRVKFTRQEMSNENTSRQSVTGKTTDPQVDTVCVRRESDGDGGTTNGDEPCGEIQQTLDEGLRAAG